ncbi:MAG: hypothetical protein CME72_11495 [Halomonadaceae bacterium]|nr:hypothetical protein [Halomonadaceae bacterium]
MTQVTQQPRRAGKTAAKTSDEVMASAKRAIAGMDMPPASARFQQGRNQHMTQRIADMVRERGIRQGTLAIRIARKIDPSVYHGQVLTIAGAEFTVKDPAQA